MLSIAVEQRLASASVVFFGRYGDVTRLAEQRGCCRQALYREADAVRDTPDGPPPAQQVERLRQRLTQLQARCGQLEARLSRAVVLDADRQAACAAAAPAEGVRLPGARRLRRPLLGPDTPSVAQLGRFSRQAARRATASWQALDEASRPRARPAAADEWFVGRRPVLMAVEPDRLCWLSGRLADQCDGDAWAQEFRQLPRLEQVVRDAGTGMAKGLGQVNRERQQQGRTAVADQADHFHVLRAGAQALRRLRGQAPRALAQAEQAQKAWAGAQRRGQKRTGLATAAARRWRQAERAWDRGSAGEKAYQRLRQALLLFSADGRLNTRARAEAEVQARLPECGGPEWSKLRRQWGRPELFTSWDRAQEQLAALPLPAEVREAAVQVEGLRRRPERLQEQGPRAAALGGLGLAAGGVLALAGTARSPAPARVRAALAGVGRASSLVEGLTSVLRMQQGRHRRLTQELLDLKRLYWNGRALRTGRRRRQTPYQRRGVQLPAVSWWELLRQSPEQLRKQLSALNLAL